MRAERRTCSSLWFRDVIPAHYSETDERDLAVKAWDRPVARRGSSVKLSLCNEVIRELPFDRQCALAAGLGYRGLEVAPFTFGDDAWRMPASKRGDVRSACADAGIEVSGLHWLLAAPAGLSITTADRAVWQKSVDVLRASVELCAELGAVYLVHGSPAQRRVAGASDERARRGGVGCGGGGRTARSSIAWSRSPNPTAISSIPWPKPRQWYSASAILPSSPWSTRWPRR